MLPGVDAPHVRVAPLEDTAVGTGVPGVPGAVTSAAAKEVNEAVMNCAIFEAADAVP